MKMRQQEIDAYRLRDIIGRWRRMGFDWERVRAALEDEIVLVRCAEDGKANEVADKWAAFKSRVIASDLRRVARERGGR